MFTVSRKVTREKAPTGKLEGIAEGASVDVGFEGTSLVGVPVLVLLAPLALFVLLWLLGTL